MIKATKLNKIVCSFLCLVIGFCCLFMTVDSLVAFAEEPANQIVKVEYLENIPDTPFARRVEKEIRIPVYPNNRILVEDVARKIGNCAYGVLNSYCERYEYNPIFNYYAPVYEKSVYLVSKTTDGNSKHYFLDINNSFYDYYAQFVSSAERDELEKTYLFDGDEIKFEEENQNVDFPKLTDFDTIMSAAGVGFSFQGFPHLVDILHDLGIYKYSEEELREYQKQVWKNANDSLLNILTTEAFSWYYGNIHKTYPQLNGIRSTDLYGYWGFVLVPHSRSINDLLASNIFDIDTTYKGTLGQFKFSKIPLSKAAYHRLLDDYGYTWLETIWADFVSLFDSKVQDADCFLFYGDGKSNTAFIAENGATDIDDNRSAIVIGGEKVINSAIDGLKDFFSGSEDKIKLILGIVLVVVVVLLLVIIVSKIVQIFKSDKHPPEQKDKKKE